MANNLDPMRVAWAVGLFAAIMHAIWSVIVALGFGQAWVNWILSLHFISSPHVVGPFDLMTAVTLIIVTFILGAIVGWIFASTWNWAARRR